jgi:hypothetical protein
VKKNDLGDLFKMMFDFQKKINSALHIDDDTRNKASDMSVFLKEKLFFNISTKDKKTIDAMRSDFDKLHSRLGIAIRKQLKRYR